MQVVMALEFHQTERNIPVMRIPTLALNVLMSRHIAGSVALVPSTVVAAWLEKHPVATPGP